MQARQPGDRISSTVLEANANNRRFMADLAVKIGQTSELRAYRWEGSPS